MIMIPAKYKEIFVICLVVGTLLFPVGLRKKDVQPLIDKQLSVMMIDQGGYKVYPAIYSDNMFPALQEEKLFRESHLIWPAWMYILIKGFFYA